MTKSELQLGKGWGLVLLLLAASLFGCGGRTRTTFLGGNDSESHFLSRCEPGGCSEGFECLCGACTRSCERLGQCADLNGAAICLPPVASTCASPSTCQVECAEDAQCELLGRDFACTQGRCVQRRDEPVVTSPLEKTGRFLRGCEGDSSGPSGPTSFDCGEGLECICGVCSVPCGSGGACGDSRLECGVDDDPRFLGQCTSHCRLEECREDTDCSALGENARCQDGNCFEVLTGACGDAFESGADYACYQEALDMRLREQFAMLAVLAKCIPPAEGTQGGATYRLCQSNACPGSERGCRLRGLSMAGGGVRLDGIGFAAPIDIDLELQIGEETVNCTMRGRVDVTTGFTSTDERRFVSPSSSRAYSDVAPREQVVGGAREAHDNGLWVQQVPTNGIGSSTFDGLSVTLSEGDPRCANFEGEVVSELRREVLYAVREQVEESHDATHIQPSECLPCGQPDCELVCLKQRR